MAAAEMLDMTAASGAALAPLTWYPGGRANAPVVLVVPALGTPAGVYRRLAEALVAQGLQVASSCDGTCARPIASANSRGRGYP